MLRDSSCSSIAAFAALVGIKYAFEAEILAVAMGLADFSHLD